VDGEKKKIVRSGLSGLFLPRRPPLPEVGRGANAQRDGTSLAVVARFPSFFRFVIEPDNNPASL
jgi:hypothetical protein